VQQAIRTKHCLHAKWIQAEPEEKEKERLLYVRARNRAKSILRKTKMMFEKNISDNAKSNPKKFWSYVRSKMKTRAGIAPLLKIQTYQVHCALLTKKKQGYCKSSSVASLSTNQTAMFPYSMYKQMC
jgi:hypothetical protein